MRIYALILSVFTALFLSSCATSGNYTQANVGQIEQIKYGTILEARQVAIGDDGAGTILGAIAGGVIGAQIGGGKNTKNLATVGGAVAGGLAGNTINSSAGQELLIRGDDGVEFSTVYKITDQNPFSFRAGDRVRIYTRNGKITKLSLER